MASVEFTEHRLSSGGLVAQAELNVASTLNSLSLEMIRLLDERLRVWQVDPAVMAVVITGAGDKAFCAGGDIQALYRAISANHAAGEVVDTYPFDFFAEEYRLDYLIHTFSKPLLVLGHGIVMGGGLGVFSGAAYRILTQRSRLAVPEITIGLFPDAGASWTLRQMPADIALFLGLTGSHVNATDALDVGMGTHVIDHDSRHGWIQACLALPWQDSVQANRDMLDGWLQDAAVPPLPASELAQLSRREVVSASLSQQAQELYAQRGRSEWIDRGLNNLSNGCPVTAGIVFEQVRRVPDLDLAGCFRMELNIATHCAHNPDFREGVRALLIDKDNQPAWKFGQIDQLDWDYVLAHFAPPWPQHPLADLA